MGSRLHGNDGSTHIVIPATADGGAPHIVIAAMA